METKGLLVNIEGFNGVGKSVVTDFLTLNSNFEKILVVDEKLKRSQQFFNSQRDINVRFAFYITATMLASEKFKRMLNQSKAIITESYIYRTIAYHIGMGATLDTRFYNSLLIPDITINLTCEENIRKKRISQRLKSRQTDKLYWDNLTEQYLDKIKEEYNKFRLLNLDTTNMCPEDVAVRILMLINRKNESYIYRCDNS